MTTTRMFWIAMVTSLVGCSSETGHVEPDPVDAGVDTDARPDGGTTEATCTNPLTGETVPDGGTIDSYTIATGATQAECDNARVTSTCTAGTFLPPPASSATCTAEPLPPAGLGLYVSDCQAGAAAGCVPGNDANPGTSAAAPKRTLAGIDFDQLAAGTQVVFARGGAWTNVRIVISNLAATPQSPIVFGSYAPSWGGTARPILQAQANVPALFEFGRYNNLDDDGGYIIRNLELRGVGEGWGLWLRDRMHDLTVENVLMTGFGIAIHSQSNGGNGIDRFTMRNSRVHRNTSMGFLGSVNNMLLENNVFSENNFSGSAFNHAIYLGGGGHDITIRNNEFLDNSVVNGRCEGGNVTAHGVWERVVLEGNLLKQTTSGGGCYGFSINPGYYSAESMRDFVVRGNTIVNLGNCAVCATSVPNILVENNLIVQLDNHYHAAITIGEAEREPQDAADDNAIVRNNTIYMLNVNAGYGVSIGDNAGDNIQVVSNLVYLGMSSNAACFRHGALAAYQAFDYNLCYRLSPGSWSQRYATLTAARAAGFDAHSLESNPGFVTMPTASSWSCELAANSGAIDAGHPTLSSPSAFGYSTRAVADIGACEQ